MPGTQKIAIAVCVGVTLLFPLDATGVLLSKGSTLRADVSLLEEQAFVVFDGATETAIVRTQFTGKGGDFAWVFPVPHPPKVELLPRVPFALLGSIGRPRTITSESLAVPGALVLLLIVTFPLLAIKRSTGWWMLGMMGALCAFVVLVVLCGSLRGRLGGAQPGVAVAPSVNTYETSRVLPYDVCVVSPIRSRDLIRWLEENNYILPAEATPTIDGYTRRDWFFAVVEVSFHEPKRVRAREVGPITLTFSTNQFVYPLKLASLGRPDSGITLYVLGKAFYRASGLRVGLRKVLEMRLCSALKDRYEVNVDCFTGRHLSKLYGSVSASEKAYSDFISQSLLQTESRSAVHTLGAKWAVLAIVISCVALLWAALYLRIRVDKMAPLLSLIVVALFLCLPVRVLVVDVSHLRELVVTGTYRRDADVKGNMSMLRLALDEFSRNTGGLYPRDINTTVGEVLNQVGVESRSAISIAGARGCDPLFFREKGWTGPALLPENYRNPYGSLEATVPVLATSAQGPPQSCVPGMVYYVPLQVDGCVARSYRIYGAGRIGLLEIFYSPRWK